MILTGQVNKPVLTCTLVEDKTEGKEKIIELKMAALQI